MSSERPRWKEFDAVRSTLMNLALFQDTFVPPPPPSSPPTSGGPGKPDTKAIEREGPDVVVGKGLMSSLLALILSSSFTLTGSANCEELLPSQLLDRENSSKPTKIERRGGKTSSSGAIFLHKVGLFGPDIDRDPIEPFTLYGDIAKKFFIENLDESGKIVSRRKGFTTTVCINAVEQSQDNPGVIGLPLSAKADRFGEPTCVEVFGQVSRRKKWPPFVFELSNRIVFETFSTHLSLSVSLSLSL
mmetsp:Transcript_4399/g.7623  ORF Transcript_4399/g.7623 Transcript_4399/m.7623 type:complete len:245 (-) Transcript_4399:120-854(-)